MINFIAAVAFIGVGICAIVFAVLIGYIFSDMYRAWRYHTRRETLPPPQRQTERMYGQQYFERAIGRKES